MDGCFCFFEAYAHFSQMYQETGKPLLSMKCGGLMDVDRTAKPFKHLMLT
jgi:hypothetical protein